MTGNSPHSASLLYYNIMHILLGYFVHVPFTTKIKDPQGQGFLPSLCNIVLVLRIALCTIIFNFSGSILKTKNRGNFNPIVFNPINFKCYHL